MLDVASGAGDVAISIAKKSARSKWPIQVSGCDISLTAISHATAAAKQHGVDIEFFQADALGDPLPEGYDVVMCSLFLHHLEEGDAHRLMNGMAAAAGRMVLINDLIRSRLGYLLAYFGTRLLTRSEIVHVDGPLSVRAAFTLREITDIASKAGLTAARISRHWPERFLLHWNKHDMLGDINA